MSSHSWAKRACPSIPFIRETGSTMAGSAWSAPCLRAMSVPGLFTSWSSSPQPSTAQVYVPFSLKHMRFSCAGTEQNYMLILLVLVKWGLKIGADAFQLQDFPGKCGHWSQSWIPTESFGGIEFRTSLASLGHPVGRLKRSPRWQQRQHILWWLRPISAGGVSWGRLRGPGCLSHHPVCPDGVESKCGAYQG